MRRILIFLFTMMLGMAIGANFAHAVTKAPVATPAAPAAKAPVPLTVGTTTRIDTNTIAVSPTGGGADISFTIVPATRIEAPGIANIKGKPTVKNISVNDIIAVASMNGSTANLITLLPKNPSAGAHKAFFGVTSSREASNSGTLLSLKHPKEDAFAKALVVAATKIFAKDIQKPTIDDIKAGDKVLVVGPANKQDVIVANRVYIIPGKARGLLDKILNSPSANKTATNTTSTKPKTSAKATAKP